jgi:purine-binding chemotaxis protein CheW
VNWGSRPKKGGGEAMTENLVCDQIAKRNVNLMEGKYLSFSMDREEYGIGILTVKEIFGMMRITPVPQTPDYVKGVINLRGKVIPVIDLRLRFGMNSSAYTERTCIIVVEIDHDSRALQIGIVPEFGTTLNTDYILGMAKTAGCVKILLDIDRVLSASKMELIGKAA